MDKIEFIKLTGLDGVEREHIIIDHGNEEFTSMLKSTYEAQQAAVSTPMVSIDAD